MTTFSATYSAEDNKLRIYASERMDSETYAEAKEHGFKWAPKQELFVAPKWTPSREDFCIKLAGSIEAEESTLVERAEAKAERLDNIADKRIAQSNAFAAAADKISERFYMGQPILVGHHSERKARKDKDQMERNMEKSIEAAEAVNYWRYRAQGVERHANHKNRDDVRARRIKTLLKELRDHQRKINHGFIILDLWTKVGEVEEQEKREKMVAHYVGARLESGETCPWGWYTKLNDNEMTHQEVIDGGIRFAEQLINSQHIARWISHTLNRLGYERSELGETKYFDGNLTATILKAFAREQGAHKPQAEKIEGTWQLSSAVPLPAHLSHETWLTLTDDGWKNLMQQTGYQVVIKERKPSKKQTCSLINPTPEDAEKLQKLFNIYSMFGKYGSESELLETTQAIYSANSKGDYGRFSAISLDDEAGRIWPSSHRDKKEPVCRVRIGGSQKLYGAERVIILTDKPQKSLPFDLDALIVSAEKKLAEHKAERAA